MKGSAFLSLSLLVGQAACGAQEDPCPSSKLWSETLDMCIDASSPAPTHDGSLETDPTPPGTADDAATEMVPDAQTPHPEMDAGLDAAVVRDSGGATGSDAAADASAIPDAAQDASSTADAANDAAQPSECSAEDQQTWAAFHVSDQLVETIKTCVASDPSCALGLCPLDTCLRDAVGIPSCTDCVEAEVRCVASKCIAECGSASDDPRCRACACKNGCVEQFGTCAGSPLDVCADCNDETCAEMSVLPPELIMLVVGQLLH